MNKKILTLDNLYEFYSLQNKTCKFNAKKSGYQISVQLPAQFEINKDLEDNSLLFCKVKLMHSGENRNHSSVTDDALSKAAKTLAYKPILANFMEYVNEETGEILKDFTSHDMEINEDGSINYLEKQIGCFTSDEPYFEIEEETGHNFLYGYCAIPREYTDAVSIIERKNGTKISVELAVNELSFNSKTKVLELTDVVIMGATCLGKNPETLEDVGEGMLNARLDIADFSAQNNSIMQYANKLDSLTSKVDLLLSRFNDIDISQEGGNTTPMNKFEELLEKYNKTVEDIDFDYESMTDEELESKFVELFDEDDDNDGDTDITPDAPSDDDETDDDDNPVVDDDDNPVVDDTKNDDEVNKDDSDVAADTNDEVKKKINNSIIKGYELSHDDIRYGLYSLLESIENADNEWYFIESVYDDHFVYSNWAGDKIFGQHYTKDGDNISFDGERYELFKELLTASEYAELQLMRSNYSALVEYKETVEKNELHAKREAILSNEKYSSISDNESFKELVKNMDNYSLEELEKEVKVIFADAITVETFASNKSTMKVFANVNSTKKDNRYGDLFNK